MYCKQMNTWLQNNGDVLLTKKTGFPLCPAGAQLGSGECFRCGLVGHHQGACESKSMIPKYKGDLLAIFGSILSSHHQPLQANFVAAEVQEFPWVYSRSSSH